MKHLVFLSIISFYTVSCNHSVKPNTFAEKPIILEPKDSADYKHIKFNFYTTKTNKLFERKIRIVRNNDKTNSYNAYYDSFIRNHSSFDKPILLDTTIDITTYAEFKYSDYSKDKNHIYYQWGNVDGNIRVIVDSADVASFKIVKGQKWDAIDKNHKYIRGTLVD
jgi:hypothetical protein